MPKAIFTWNSVGNGSIQFTNTSTEADSYVWDFGDATPPNTEKNPLHTFQKNQKYTVTLTVKNPSGTDKISSEVSIDNLKPVIDFSWTQSNGWATFVNKSQNAESYKWDFGDGATSTEANPTHRYMKGGNYTVKLTGYAKSLEAFKWASVDIGTVILNLSDVVDDQSLVSFLPGKWGSYEKGIGQRFNNYNYSFSASSNTMNYENFYNSYQYINSYATTKIDYTFSILNKILYTDNFNGTKSKYARIQILSEDEMKFFLITETDPSYSELMSFVLTRISDTEKSMNDVVRSPALRSTLLGVWDQGAYSIYKDVFFDFSSGKNFYNYNSTLQESKSIAKYEYKIDDNNVMSYRSWASSFDPSWKKYKVEVASPTSIKLYPIDIASGEVSTQAEYTLKKRP